jgi:PAS domain S-box-containing protein
MFYQAVEDLLDVLPPFFKAGLEQHERCIMLASPHVGAERLSAALRSGIPDYERHVASGALEFLDVTQAYGDVDHFDRARTIALWKRKLADALDAGFAGVRGCGDEAWLDSRNWESFAEYEAELDNVIHGQPLLFLCAYPIDDRRAADVFEIARRHDTVIARLGQRWQVLEDASRGESRLALEAQRAQLQHELLQRQHQLDVAQAKAAEASAERAALEREVRTARDRFTTVIATSPLMVAIKRRQDDRFVEVNDAFVRKLGYARGDVLGRTSADIGMWLDPAERDEANGIIAAQDRLDGFEMAAQARDGRRLDLVTYVQPMQLEGETCLLAMWYDQTGSKNVERELVEQQWRFAEAERLSRTGSWQMTAGRMTWSEELYRLHGQAPGSFTPSLEAWLTLVHPADRTRFRVALDSAMSDLRFYDVEHRVALPDGGVRHFRSVGYCARARGDAPARAVGYTTDITELRETMEQLRATSRKLVDLQEVGQRRLATEIHDRIGQLLTATAMNLETIRSRIPAADAHTHHRLDDSIRLVQRATESVVNILGDLRPSALEELGFVPAVARYATTFQRRTGVETSFHADDSLRVPPEWATPLFRIVQEGLMNVAKHAGARHAAVRLSSTAEQLVVRIEDDGIGIGVAGAPGEASSGLGLVTTRERVAALGGTFGVGAREGGGTRLEVRLPLGDEYPAMRRRSGMSGNS